MLNAVWIGSGGVLASLGLLFVVSLVYARCGARLAERRGQEGRAFGATHSDVACLESALAGFRGDYFGYQDHDEAEYLRRCLKVASRTPQFCEDVPSPAQPESSRIWFAERSRELACPIATCSRLIGAVQYHCLGRVAPQ